MRKHFDMEHEPHKELARVVEQLRKRNMDGDAFLGVPYVKLKVWVEIPLRDKRVKSLTDKKILKTFRLNPAAVETLKEKAKTKGCTETQVIESLLTGV